MATSDPSPRFRSGDQIPPRTDRDAKSQASVQDELARRIEQRRELGQQRYGTDLRIFNGRDAVRDAADEALDLATYLIQIDMEREAMSASGGTGALVEMLGRFGVDTSRDNIIRVSQMVERLQAWGAAQVSARTNWLARKLADSEDEKRRAQYELEETKTQLAEARQHRVVLVDANVQRVEMLLVAWEPCTPAWCASHAPNACAMTARAWVPGGTNHYHPRGVDLPRENAIELKVHDAERAVHTAGATEYEEYDV